MPRILISLLASLLLLASGCAPWRADVQAAPRPLTYVAIGASDSVGVGAPDPDRDGWVARFYAQLPPGSSLTNLGVSGSLLSQALDEQLPVAIAARPDVVTVWLAVNDLNARVPLEQYAANLDRLLGELEATGATVLVGNVPDVGLLPVYREIEPTLLQSTVDTWNAAIAGAAERHHAVLVDLHAQWSELAQHPEYVSGDGFHPSAEGYARLADIFWQAYQASAQGIAASG